LIQEIGSMISRLNGILDGVSQGAFRNIARISIFGCPIPKGRSKTMRGGETPTHIALDLLVPQEFRERHVADWGVVSGGKHKAFSALTSCALLRDSESRQKQTLVELEP
jgi:hypothetical protein